MKIVIGVNDFEIGLKLGDFVSRLQFKDAEYHFIHALLPLIVPPGDSVTGDMLNELEQANQAELKRREAKLTEIAAKFHETHSLVSSSVVRGSAVTEIIGYSERIGADLIVIGRQEHSAIDRLFLGSVSRGLVIGAKQSLLVVKIPVESKSGRLGAVFAVDHSAYCNKCVERFRSFAPRGLSHLTVLSITTDLDIARLHWALPERLRDLEKALVDKVKAKTWDLAHVLTGMAPVLEATSEIGDRREVIRKTVEQSQSELLILGAKGHSLIERLSVGSVSLQQALEERHSVLIVRV